MTSPTGATPLRTHDDTHEPVREPVLRGAYVSLEALLAIRYRPTATPRRTPPIVRNQQGTRMSKMRGRGVDFAEVRAYQPGDDVRTLDWRVTARKNKPHTKVFREERERLTFVVVDQTQSMFFGSQQRLKSVAAAEVAACAAWQGLQHNDRVGGIVLGNHQAAIHKPYRSSKAVARLMSDIAEYNQSLKAGTSKPDEDALNDSLLRLRRLTHTNYRIYLISDFFPHNELWRDAWGDAIRALARHNEVVAVQIYDPLEARLPPADRYTVTDGTNRLQFHAGDTHLRAEYQARFDNHQQWLKTLCGNSRVRYRAQSTAAAVGNLDQWI